MNWMEYLIGNKWFFVNAQPHVRLTKLLYYVFLISAAKNNQLLKISGHKNVAILWTLMNHFEGQLLVFR